MDALTAAGIHLLVTPIAADDGGSGAIAYTRIGEPEFDENELSALRIYAAQLSAVLANARLIARNRDLLVSGIRALVSAVDAKDPYTRGHSERVSQLARLLATEMELATQEIDTIELAGLLHDFGKIGVPDAILHKPDKLTPAERAIMMRHANLGADMLARANSDALAPLVPLVRHHHEWVNGGGYPDGLIGEQIPIGSAIISVADAYDTMTTDRPYRTRISHRQAMAELNRSMGRQFSASVVAALEALSSHGQLAAADAEAPAGGELSRVPLAAEESTPIGDAQALKLLIDMIPLTHLIAESEQFYQQVTDLVREALHLPTLSLHLTDNINGGLARIACSGEGCEALPKWQPLAAGIRGAAMRSRQFRIVGDVKLDPAHDPAHDPAAGSMLVTPLIVDETVIGLLAVESRQSRSIDPTHLAVLQIIAGQIASAVRLAQLHAEARAAAVTDPWTGLGNHRAFWDALDRAAATGDEFRVGMLDLAGLRRLNREQGHHAGDVVLKRVAEVLHEQVAAPELAARLGGGQFGLVLQECNAEREAVFLAALQQAVAGSAEPAITLRVGCAAYPGDAQTGRELVARAESRLAPAEPAEPAEQAG
jgi:diguanylate cyclase (GGDEF)-like protein